MLKECLYINYCYLLTPCLLLHQILQLCKTPENIEEDADDPEPADTGDIQMENSSDLL